MPTSNPLKHDELLRTLSVTACADLAKRERKYLLSCLILWFASVIFIISPPEHAPDGVNPTFLQGLFNRELLHWRVLGRTGDSYRSLLPEILYRHIQDAMEPIQSDFDARIAATDFSDVSISNQSTPPDFDGDSIRGSFAINPTAEDRTYYRHLNMTRYIIDNGPPPAERLPAPAVAFYEDYFVALAQATREERRQDHRLFFEGSYLVLKFDSDVTFEFFSKIDFSAHATFVQDLITNDALLQTKYTNAYIHGLSYDVPLLPFQLGRSWIVWFLPVALLAILAYVASLARLRVQLIERISRTLGPVHGERVGLLIHANAASLRYYLGRSRGRLLKVRPRLRTVALIAFGLVLLFTPLLNLVFFRTDSIGIAAIDDAEALAPALYVMFLGLTLFFGVLFAMWRWGIRPFSRWLRDLLPKLGPSRKGGIGGT